MIDCTLKRIVFFLSFCVLSISAFSQEEAEKEGEFSHHCLNEERSLTIGLAGIYSNELESIGIHGRMYYNIGESICFGPEYSFIKTEEIEIVDFDFVGHYIFETPWVGIYPLVGVNYSVEEELEHDETIAEVGLVFGAGIHRNFKNFTGFIEYSRVEYGIEDQFITFGLMYNFK